MSNHPATPEQLLQRLKAGGDSAATKLWNLYFERMVAVAARKLYGKHRVSRDEEDIAISAFKSFCKGIQAGRFEGAADQDSLWPLLVTLTINKAIDHLRHENRAKRAGDRNAPLAAENLISEDVWLHEQTSPELQAIANESFQKLFQVLDETGDAALAKIAMGHVQGLETESIAEEMGCSSRTVQRKLMTIRAIWESILQ
jgi:RNA polymerase sigma factor (sigma-70 family)